MIRDEDIFKRHNLIFFSRRNINTIVDNSRAVLPDAPKEYWSELFELIGTRIPGIVRRQESKRDGYVEVGFSSPRYFDGVRYRVSASVPIADINEVVTPFEVMKTAISGNKIPNKNIISRLYSLACDNEISVGLLGSYALQAVTELDYTNATSDIDLIVQGNSEAFSIYATHIREVEKHFCLKTDTEARIPVAVDCGTSVHYDVKLYELLTESKYIMGKGISDVALLQCTAAGFNKIVEKTLNYC